MKPGSKQVNDMDALKLGNDTIPLEEQPLIVNRRLEVSRNIGYPLLPNLPYEDKREIERKVQVTLQAISSKYGGLYYPLADLPVHIKSALQFRDLLPDKGDRSCEMAGINRDWPSGRGVYCNEDFSLVIWVNQQDHLKIIANECNGGDLNGLFGKVAEIHAVLD